MTTDISSDGENILHDGAAIYIRRVATLPDRPEKYRIQIYRDGLPGHQFYQSFEEGTLTYAQEFAIATANVLADVIAPKPDDFQLICPQCAQVAKFSKLDMELTGGHAYCNHHGAPVSLITMAEFDKKVALLEMHPDDFNLVG